MATVYTAGQKEWTCNVGRSSLVVEREKEFDMTCDRNSCSTDRTTRSL